MSINLALNNVSQASLHKLYLQSLELLIDNEISQDTEVHLEAEAYSFTSQATSFDLQKVYTESSFVNENSQLANKAQSLPADKCPEKFMLILINIIQSLANKS